MTPPLRHRVRGRSWLRVAALSLSAWFCSCSRHLDDMSHLSVCLSVSVCVCVCVHVCGCTAAACMTMCIVL